MSQYSSQPCPQCGTPLDGWGECPNCGALGGQWRDPGTWAGGAWPGQEMWAGGPAQPGMGGGEPPRRGSASLIVLLVLVLVVATAVGAGIVVLTHRGQQVAVDSSSPAQTAGPDAPSPSAPEPESSQTPQQPESTAPSSTQTSPAAPTSTTPTQNQTVVTVMNTCGRDGTGDCFLTERGSPSTSGTSLKRWQEGEQLTVVCQVRGSTVRASATGVSSNVWSRTSTGGYVTNVYLDGISQTAITQPCT